MTSSDIIKLITNTLPAGLGRRSDLALLGAIERPGEVMEGCGCSTNCQKELTGGGGAVVVAGNGYGSEQSRRRWARVRSEEGEAAMAE